MASGEPRREPDSAGFVLPLLLLGGFRAIIDELHAELASQGHPDLRPAHGFAMQAIGRAGTTATELGRRLGVSKQAAGKTVDRLESLGYVERIDDPADARRKRIRLSERGSDVLARSAVIFERLRRRWATTLGEERLRDLESALREMQPHTHFPLDSGSWFGA
ncbi:MarR family winged helix-turn-helix transcriptional regulator [Saccharomonospora xinjiangensis]|uniref:MarR family winged helix-turn-helix transcriptional regulator n=1 Tax=Saccharomonospora xinjiangensis TaxID=75294 RepID=UPI00106F8803|nr:MarR family winged helix-turn-helix transcriptional regulator [Saccharomonospora xinjiangensis]QBQ62012.1 MarR family protein [Saccharomonospora xinjiangensis]